MKLGGLDINLWGVVLAAVAATLVGAIYYADWFTGKEWKKLAKVDAKRFNKTLPQNVIWVFVGSLGIAYLLGFTLCLYQAFYNVPWLTASLATALILWAVVAISVAVHNLMEQKPLALTIITIGGRFVTLLTMALVYSKFHP